MIHHKHPVAVYIIYGCKYCKKAIQILQQSGIPYKAENIGSNAQLAMQLYRETGSPKVPKVFVNGQFIGGADRLQHIVETGQLARALRR